MLGAVIELAEVSEVQVPTLKAHFTFIRILDNTVRKEKSGSRGTA